MASKSFLTYRWFKILRRLWQVITGIFFVVLAVKCGQIIYRIVDVGTENRTDACFDILGGMIDFHCPEKVPQIAVTAALPFLALIASFLLWKLLKLFLGFILKDLEAS